MPAGRQAIRDFPYDLHALLVEGDFLRRRRLLSRLIQLAGLGSIFRSAFSLDLRGVEGAVRAHLAFGQSLRAVAEGVGQRLTSGVDDVELLVLADQRESDFASPALDGILLDVAGHSQLLLGGFRTHLPHFGDGFVLTLRLSHTRGREPEQCAENNDDQNGKLAVFFHKRLVNLQYTSGDSRGGAGKKP